MTFMVFSVDFFCADDLYWMRSRYPDVFQYIYNIFGAFFLYVGLYMLLFSSEDIISRSLSVCVLSCT